MTINLLFPPVLWGAVENHGGRPSILRGMQLKETDLDRQMGITINPYNGCELRCEGVAHLARRFRGVSINSGKSISPTR